MKSRVNARFQPLVWPVGKYEADVLDTKGVPRFFQSLLWLYSSTCVGDAVVVDLWQARLPKQTPASSQVVDAQDNLNGRKCRSYQYYSCKTSRILGFAS